eukprot:TRINITY_DN9038_c0_g1_i1.p1 TRINITY_DN9038_c0_g1~~TRINITY_DN9038_c0_g1_i1.p1  ORF type:complete len:563 (+),score=87.29 TRINITY_DN9038_c0_g1_i1:153-1841(+)
MASLKTKLCEMSLGGLKNRVKELGLEMPPHIAQDHRQLLEFVEAAEEALARERHNGRVPPAPPLAPHAPPPAPPAQQGRSIDELKARLLELGHDIPSNISERIEFHKLVEESEKRWCRTWRAAPESPNGGRSAAKPPPPPPPPQPASPVLRSRFGDSSLPPGWYAKASRSYAGSTYYVNAETGETTWTKPQLDEILDVWDVTPTADNSLMHDYRDDAFEDHAPMTAAEAGACLQDAAVDAACASARRANRRWSRAATMTCEQSEEGLVTTLTLSSKAPFPKFAGANEGGNLVKGSAFTWMRGDMIGRGSLGRVFEALNTETGHMFAVKEVLVSNGYESDQKLRRDLENEVNIMRDLRHEHIVAYLGHDYIDGCLYLYLEHMPGGSLTQALQQFGSFDEALVAVYCKQLLLGLEYLHTRDPVVIHRDVKGGNILVSMDSSVKLADFGCSKRVQETLTQSMRGSIPWMAPEVIMHSHYGRKADIWSFGCAAIEMSTAAVPWGRMDNQMSAMFRIGMSNETPPLPKGKSPLCHDFIGLCVQRDPSVRPLSQDLLEHEFVRDLAVG